MFDIIRMKKLYIYTFLFCITLSSSFSEDTTVKKNKNDESENIISDSSNKDEENKDAASSRPLDKIYAPKIYKYARIKLLEKSTGIVTDGIFSPQNNEKVIKGLKIKCCAAFSEEFAPSITAHWVFLEIFQQTQTDEWTLVYSNWANNLKPIFENPDYDFQIMEVIS